jgi:3-hydroxyisobutyrate dehydrogenase/glyoxylate/succinic semialdehyde reductase
MRIGFVGTGLMGSRMAANVLSKDDELLVYNRTRSKAEALQAHGATVMESPGAVAQKVEILFSMLTGPEAVEVAALGTNGFLPHLKEGTVWVDCSTVNPSFSMRMASEARQRKVAFLDAPVAGTIGPAEAGELLVLAGGEAEVVERVQPLLDRIGRKTLHMGENGRGSAMKMVVNTMLAQSMVAFSEATKLGESLGLDRGTLLEALIGGPVTAPYLAGKRENFESRQYEPAFPLKHITKDLHLAVLSGYEAGVSLPSTAIAKEIFSGAKEAGRGDEDFSALFDSIR